MAGHVLEENGRKSFADKFSEITPARNIPDACCLLLKVDAYVSKLRFILREIKDAFSYSSNKSIKSFQSGVITLIILS